MTLFNPDPPEDEPVPSFFAPTISGAQALCAVLWTVYFTWNIAAEWFGR